MLISRMTPVPCHSGWMWITPENASERRVQWKEETQSGWQWPFLQQKIALKIKRKWLYANVGKDGVVRRKRAKVDLFSTLGMSCKSEGKPESEDLLGMAESPEGLELVARAKIPKEGTGKVSVRHVPNFLTLEIWGRPIKLQKQCSLLLWTLWALSRVVVFNL